MLKALRHLKKTDPILGRVIEKIGPFRLERKQDGTHFAHVLRAILYQQLSGKAAATIHSRVKGLWDGRDPAPHEVLAMPEEKLRAAGVSRQKLGYLKDLSSKIVSGEIEMDALDGLEDEAIIEALIKAKGVGRWTVQMFLMFRLGRLDVLPLNDLGIQKAVMQAYKMKHLPQPKDLEKIGANWRPYATVACWYLWRSLDVPGKVTATAPQSKRQP